MAPIGIKGTEYPDKAFRASDFGNIFDALLQNHTHG